MENTLAGIVALTFKHDTITRCLSFYYQGQTHRSHPRAFLITAGRSIYLNSFRSPILIVAKGIKDMLCWNWTIYHSNTKGRTDRKPK